MFGMNQLTIAAVLSPPLLQGGIALRRGAIGLIGDDNIG